MFEQKLKQVLPKPCIYCNTPMSFHHAHVFTTHWDKGMTIRAVDIQLKCPQCYNVQRFGVPLTQQEYNKIVAEFDNKNLDFYRLDKKRIKERLQQLGYLEVNE